MTFLRMTLADITAISAMDKSKRQPTAKEAMTSTNVKPPRRPTRRHDWAAAVFIIKPAGEFDVRPTLLPLAHSIAAGTRVRWNAVLHGEVNQTWGGKETGSPDNP